VILTEQLGIVRTESAINAATTVDSFQDLLEELHVLALAQVGAASYNAFGGGNLFNFEGGVLTTNFTTVNVDSTAADKIAYNSATNTLTVRSSVMTDTATVTRWNNGGAINLQNGAQIQGIYSANGATNKILEINGVTDGSSIYVGNNATGVTTLYQADTDEPTYRVYFDPGTVPAQLVARELYPFQRFSQVITLVDGLNVINLVDIEDVGIDEDDLATVLAYTSIETPSKFYDRTAAFRLTEQGIKLGQMVTRSGNALEIGTFSHIIDKNAAQIYTVTGSTITSKSSSYSPDTRYQTEIAIPPSTIEAADDEVITVNIEDANGDSSVNIQASGVSTFEVWKIANSVSPDDYETGELLDTVDIGIYRFLSAPGFKMVIRDITTNFRVVSPMEKGNYEAALFFGGAVQLAQAPEVTQINTKVDVLSLEIEQIKGTGFGTNQHSLVKLRQHVTNASQF
jgi:hypothetical protein